MAGYSMSSISILMQATGTGLTMLVCVAGVVLAIVFWQRCRTASILVRVAAGLMILAGAMTILVPLAASAMHGGGGMNMPLIAGFVVANLIRAAGMGVLIAAAFVGRPATTGGRTQVPQSGTPMA